MEQKINALKDFAIFGSSKKPPSSNDNISINNGSSSPASQNGQWGNWFKKAEDDPYLPSLVIKFEVSCQEKFYISTLFSKFDTFPCLIRKDLYF